jgi:hypothetical protein
MHHLRSPEAFDRYRTQSTPSQRIAFATRSVCLSFSAGTGGRTASNRINLASGGGRGEMLKTGKRFRKKQLSAGERLRTFCNAWLPKVCRGFGIKTCEKNKRLRHVV